jgi:hypothetical protein
VAGWAARATVAARARKSQRRRALAENPVVLLFRDDGATLVQPLRHRVRWKGCLTVESRELAKRRRGKKRRRKRVMMKPTKTTTRRRTCP